MSLPLLLFFVFGTLASQAMSRTMPEADIVDKHEQWMATYSRKYENQLEKEKRYQIFKDNLEYIESFNNDGNRSYKLGINEFTDMTHDEFLAARTGYMMPVNQTASTPFRYESFSDIPTNLDWREKGAVTHVKYQQNCGCCWAFSAVAAMEGLTQIKKGNLISLSEQQLLDCTTNFGNHGCQGGLMTNAFEYVKQNQGITTEDYYPYQAMQGACNMQKSATQSAATISGYEMVPANDEEALLKAVTNQPVSIGIDASGQEFKYYQSGVFTGDCGTYLNHAVTIIGFGTSEEGIDYWLIKNSWGESWGENGYMKIQRGAGYNGGLCGLAMKASYPTA